MCRWEPTGSPCRPSRFCPCCSGESPSRRIPPWRRTTPSRTMRSFPFPRTGSPRCPRARSMPIGAGTVGRRPRRYPRHAVRRSHGDFSRLRSRNANHPHARGDRDLPEPIAPAPGKTDRGEAHPGEGETRAHAAPGRRKRAAGTTAQRQPYQRASVRLPRLLPGRSGCEDQLEAEPARVPGGAGRNGDPPGEGQEPPRETRQGAHRRDRQRCEEVDRGPRSDAGSPRRGNPSRGQKDARDARRYAGKREPHAGTRRRRNRSGGEENPRGTAAGNRLRRTRAGQPGQHVPGAGRSGAAGSAGRHAGDQPRRQIRPCAGRLSREEPQRAHSRQDPGEALMRNRTAVTVISCCILASVVAGCASPRSDFYTLSRSSKAAPATADYSVAVGPVSVPEIVDRPQIVVRTGANQVFIDEFHRWGSPLRDDIARGVAGNLSALLGAPRVSVFPHPTFSAAKYRVAIAVMAFDSAPGESASLDAVWGIRGPGEGAIRSGRTTVRETVSDAGYSALIAAHSRALERLCGDIADAIRGLERDERQK